MECDEGARSEDVYRSLKSLNFTGIHSFKLEGCPSPQEPLTKITGLKTFRKIEIFDTDNFDLSTLYNTRTQELKLSFIQDLTVMDGMIEMPTLESLDINNIQNLNISGRPFEGSKNLKRIKIWRSKLDSVGKDLFHGLENVTSIFLQDNSIKFLAPGTFDMMEDLKYLQLANNRLKTLPRDVFKFNRKLRVVQLNNNCLLQSLPENLFSNQENMTKFLVMFHDCRDMNFTFPNDLFNNPSLEEVKLLYVQTKTLPKHLLRGCGNLEKFVFQSGGLEEIDEYLFTPTKNIRVIDFANNKISYIRKEAFQSLPELSRVRLHINKLTELPQQLFAGSPNVKKMELQRNRFTSFDVSILNSLNKLEDINLSVNLLNTPPCHTNSNLEKIDLSKNNISKVDFDVLTKMKNLRIFDVSENKLTDYLILDNDPNVTRSLMVDLSNNRIEGVKLRGNKENSYKVSSAPVLILNLKNNPLKCDCFATEIKRRNTSQNPQIDPDDYKCDSGQSLRETDYSDLVCPTSDCPPGCQCIGSELHRNIKCQKRNMTDLPQYWASGSGDHSVSLHLEDNQIETVNRTTLALWERVSELHLSGNKIERLHHHLLSSQLRTLSLDNNRIATIPADTINKLEALTNLSLRLGNNQFQCSCDNVRLVEFVQSHRERFLDWSNITIDCKDQQDIASLRRDQVCPPFEPELFIVGISLLIVAVVLIIFLFVYRDLIMIFIFSHSFGRYLFSEDLLDNTKEYDVFLSYAHQDSQYVEETLLPGLESPDNPQHQYKCLIHTRNWLPGYSIPDQILNSVHTTRRTIIVLSSSYLQSMWSLMEFQAAYVKTMEENVQVIMVIYSL